RRLDIDDDRRLQVDQVVVGVGKERMPFVSAGPLGGRIRPGDELRYRLAGCAPGRLIQGIEIFPDGSARPGNGLPVDIIRPGSRALLVGIGSNQAGIDSKGRTINQPFCHAASDHGLEQLAQQIAIAEAAMPILGEGRVVRHPAIETEPGRTSGRRGSGEPPRTTAVRSECRSSSQPATSGPAVQDQSRAGRSSYKKAPGGPEPLRNRQSDQSTSASGPPEHVAQARTRKTVPPDRPAEDPSSIQSPTTKELNQRSPSASIVEFFNTIGAK